MTALMFYFGIATVIICAFSMTPAYLLYFRTHRWLPLYIALLLTTFLIEFVELLYIARFGLPDNLPHFNLIHYPVLRIVTTVSFLLLDVLILLEIMEKNFKRLYLLWFVPLIIFCAYIAVLEQTELTIWLFYSPREFYRFGICIYFIYCLLTEQREEIRNRLKSLSFLIMGFFLLNCSVLLEDCLLIFHTATFFNDMISITERNLSENVLWIFICIYADFYCIRKLTKEERVRTGQSHESVYEASDTIDSNTALLEALPAICEYYRFTPREAQILNCLIQYKSTADICDELFISTGTVKTHTHNIYAKVNVNSRHELIRLLSNFSRENQ